MADHEPTELWANANRSVEDAKEKHAAEVAKVSVLERDLRALLDGYLERIQAEGHRIAGSGLVARFANNTAAMITSSKWDDAQQARGFLDYIRALHAKPGEQAEFSVKTTDGWEFYWETHATADWTWLHAVSPDRHHFRVDPSTNTIEQVSALSTYGGVRG